MKLPRLTIIFIYIACSAFISSDRLQSTVYIRHNLIGYLADDDKVALAFSNQPISGKFTLINNQTQSEAYSGKVKKLKSTKLEKVQILCGPGL